MQRIKRKLKSRLIAFSFYIKSRPKLFKLALQVLSLFPKLDKRIRTTLSNSPTESSFNENDVITKVESAQRLDYLKALKQEIETIKKRKI